MSPRMGGSRADAEHSPQPAELVSAANALAERAALPARVANAHFCTAGFADRELLHSGFYPPEVTTPEQRLAHYARHFSLVEIDTTYYALLAPDIARRWLSAAPPGFLFDVKAHPIFTAHPIDVRRLPADLRSELGPAHGARVYRKSMPEQVAHEIEARFLSSIEPLRHAGRLGAVLLQFPPWFVRSQENVRLLDRTRERFAALPFAVEFRHPSWLEQGRRERTFELLSGLGMSYVCVDEPQARIGGLPPLTRVTNAALGLVRFHGRNSQGWNRRGASVVERFDYLYHPRELEGWLAGMRELMQSAESVHAVFNNCVSNYAVLGAKGLSALLAADQPLH